MAISASGKEWRFPPQTEVDAELVKIGGGSDLLARLLQSRGITSAEAAAVYLDSSKYTPTSPMAFSDMSQAVIRISQAIAENEQITIYGDYDVDGVTGTSVLVSVLKLLGAKVDYYIPNRTGEGYGLNLKAVSILASKRRTKLIITCDCGISNFAEINFAKSLGLDTIITDHHTMPDLLPPAVATLHPKRFSAEHPLYDLPGVGVAYKLCEALLVDRGMPEEVEKLLDYVTLGMIADLVPLVRENRYLVQIGLPKLVQSQRPGIKALLAQVSTNGGTDVVGFGLAPRINAVGRLADANLAVELMTTTDNDVAEKLARQLQVENGRRQELCDQIMLEADQMVASSIDLTKDRAIVIYKDGWHHGVVGIVASRLVEKYHCPVFIGELDVAEGIVKGSARGVEGIDLFQVLKANEQLMTKWGGHKMAAGFSLEAGKAEVFARALTDTCNSMLKEANLKPALTIDALVKSEQVSMDLVKLLSQLAPFGMANKKPVLVMTDLQCVGSRTLGKEGKHSRLMLKDPLSGQEFESVYWNSRGKVPNDQEKLDLAFTAEINTYNGRDRLQLVLVDWRSHTSERHVAQSATPTTTVVENKPVAAVSARPTESVPLVATQTVEPEKQPAKTVGNSVGVATFNWKDLRQHEDPSAVLKTAVSKLSGKLAVFAEGCPAIPGVTFTDRNDLSETAHLLIWQYPPALQTFKQILSKSKARNIYLVGGRQVVADDAPGFLKKLLGLVRFAVNQREGKAEGDKLAAALATSKMSLALGLTVLRKLHAIDWFAEEGFLYLDVLEQPDGSAEQIEEYRQLSNALKEVADFRAWCVNSSFKDIQLALTPNHIVSRRTDEPDRYQDRSEDQLAAVEFEQA